MYRIRLHGRGGQGGVTLAKIIATSRFLQGMSVQASGVDPHAQDVAGLRVFLDDGDVAAEKAHIGQRFGLVVIPLEVFAEGANIIVENGTRRTRVVLLGEDHLLLNIGAAHRRTVSLITTDVTRSHTLDHDHTPGVGHAVITLEPGEKGSGYEFVDKITGGSIPREFISSCDKGFKACLAKGSLIGSPITGVRLTINDGAAHSVDSSDMAFQAAARAAFRDAYRRAAPQILEPVMKVSVEGPSEFQGAIYRSLLQRRGTVLGSTEDAGFARVDAEVPLAEMFGYSTTLRSLSQGRAVYSMEFNKYSEVPQNVADTVMRKAS